LDLLNRPHQGHRHDDSGAKGGGASELSYKASRRAKTSVDELRHVHYPRFDNPAFAEFAQLESREYYRIKKEKTIGSVEVALAKTPELVKQTEKLLEELAALFHSNRAVNAGGVSDDDIDLFGRLRGLTLVKGLKWPKKLREYIDYSAEAADIPLLDSMAQY
jgi:glutaredoxin 2